MLPCALSDRSPLIMQPTKFCLIGNKGLEGKNRLQKINELHREKSSVKFTLSCQFLRSFEHAPFPNCLNLLC